MDQEKHEPKISLPEAIYVGLFVFTADALEAGLLLFGLDDFGISDVIAFPATQIYLRMKGVRGMFMLMGNIAEVFPYVGWMPLRSIGFWATVIVDHNPQLGKVVTTVTAVTKGGATTTTGMPGAGAATTTAGAPVGGAASMTTTTPPGASTTTARAPSTGREGAEAEEPPSVAATPETGAEEKPAISEEQFGVEKEPIEKLQELMEKIPEAEEKDEEEEGARPQEEEQEEDPRFL